MPNVLLTTAGMDYIMAAQVGGPKIGVKYFLPVYDHRYDTLIHDSEVSAISACMNPGAAAPVGEKIYNTAVLESYTLSDQNKSYIIFDGSEVTTPDTVSNSVQNKKFQVNLKGGVPLKTHFYGVSAQSIGTRMWKFSQNWTMAVGSNLPEVDDKTKLYPVDSYYPSTSTSGNVKGTFKCRLEKNIGEVKFNKIALYVVKFDNLGNETADAPVFFGETYLKTTMVKSKLGAMGFNDITADVQFDIRSVSATSWDNIFYSTSADYWSKSPDGSLYYPGNIGVGNFTDSMMYPRAAAHFRKPANSNLPNLRLDYGDYDHTDITVSANGVTTIGLYSQYVSSSLIMGPSIGDNNYPAIYPNTSGLFDIGKASKRFRNLSLNNNLSVSASSSNFINVGATGTTTSDGYNITVGGDVAYTGAQPYLQGLDLIKASDNNFTFSIFSKERPGISVQLIMGSGLHGINNGDGLKTANSGLSTSTSINTTITGTIVLLSKQLVTYGQLEVDVGRTYTDGANQVRYPHGVVLTKKSNLTLIGGMKTNSGFTFYSSTNILDIIRTGSFGSITGLLLPDSNIDLISNSVTSYGNILPASGSGSALELGSTTNRWARAHIDTINMMNGQIIGAVSVDCSNGSVSAKTLFANEVRADFILPNSTSSLTIGSEWNYNTSPFTSVIKLGNGAKMYTNMGTLRWNKVTLLDLNNNQISSGNHLDILDTTYVEMGGILFFNTPQIKFYVPILNSITTIKAITIESPNDLNGSNGLTVSRRLTLVGPDPHFELKLSDTVGVIGNTSSDAVISISSLGVTKLTITPLKPVYVDNNSLVTVYPTSVCFPVDSTKFRY